MAPFVMKVQGEAIIPKTAERAVFDLEISSESETRQTASDEVTTTAKQVQKLLKEYSPSDSSEEAKAAAAIAKWSMGKMNTSSHARSQLNTDRVSYSQQRVYTARVGFSIRIKDFAKLGMLAHTFSQMQHLKIQRTSWLLTAPTRRAYKSDLRKMAAADALRRAQDYAESLGLSKVRPLELTEQAESSSWLPYHMGYRQPGLQQQQMQMQQQSMMQTQAGTAGGRGGVGDEGVDLFFEPDEIQLTMTVDCKFSAE